jgi:hypothetical protein
MAGKRRLAKVSRRDRIRTTFFAASKIPARGRKTDGERQAIVKSEDWEGPSFQACMEAAYVCKGIETSRRARGSFI